MLLGHVAVAAVGVVIYYGFIRLRAVLGRRDYDALERAQRRYARGETTAEEP